jgi:RNA polymerase sigma factor (sigma-70 family)
MRGRGSIRRQRRKRTPALRVLTARSGIKIILQRGVIFGAAMRIMHGIYDGNSASMTTPELQRQFVQLLQTHHGIVYKVAGCYSWTPADRADLVQEICLQLWRAFPRYDNQRKFSTWMYRVALNVAISQTRRTRRPDVARFEPLDEMHLETLVAADADRERLEQLEVMYAFIAQLEPLNRALILLYLDDHSYTEIADILGIRETNVATKISRIKCTLRGRMTIDKSLEYENGTGRDETDVAVTQSPTGTAACAEPANVQGRQV